MSNLGSPVIAPTPNSTTTKTQPPKKCLVLSLIRHAESRGNKFGNVTDKEACLTYHGIGQAESLGKDWRDVHIDVLLASTLQRAHVTALAIAKYNHNTTLKVITDCRYVEKKMGQAVIDAIRARNIEGAKELRTGLRPGQSGKVPRDHIPPGGGESLEIVAARAVTSLIELLHKHGKELDEPPREFVDETVIDSPNILPEGIPHVAMVSHNIYLTELYESMFSWGWDVEHRMTTCEYHNTDCKRDKTPFCFVVF